MDQIDRLLTVEELAEYLALPLATIYGWRYRGIGPVGFRVGRHVRFRFTDVERWIEAQLEESGNRSRRTVASPHESVDQ